MPTAQLTHVDAVDKAPKRPAEQAVHLLVPVDRLLYEPEEHDVHWADVLADATSPYEPLMHAVQPLVPVARALYLPATHAVHAEVPVVSAL